MTHRIKKPLMTICLLLFLYSSSVIVHSSNLGHFMLVDTAFTVPASQAMVYNFSVGNEGGTVTGRFRASGGSGNDIQVLILDKDAYENWRNGHTVNTYYNSGKITVANIKVTLSQGDYVLVFSNMYSAITPKAVEAHVALDW